MKICPLILWIILVLSCPGAELEFMFTGDLHGNLENLANLAPVIRRYDHAIKIDLGDISQGDFYSELTGGKVMIEALNRLKYDFFIPGNHDFETEYSKFSAMINQFKGVVLGANWRWHSLKGLSWVLLRRQGIKCAIIGLTEFRMNMRKLPDSGMIFTDHYKLLKRIMDEIRKHEPQLVVLLTHNGQYAGNDTLDAFHHEFPEIDIIVGAHTHEEIPCARIGKNALLVQAGNRGSAVGIVKVVFDDGTGEISKITSRLERPETIPDYEISQLWKQTYQLGTVVANLPAGFFSSKEDFGQTMAENLRNKGQSDMAIFLSGRWFPATAGIITIGDRYKMLPYNNELVKITVSAAEWEKLQQELNKKALRFYVSGTPEKTNFTLTLSDYTLLISESLKKHVNDRSYSRLNCLERDVF